MARILTSSQLKCAALDENVLAFSKDLNVDRSIWNHFDYSVLLGPFLIDLAYQCSRTPIKRDQ